MQSSDAGTRALAATSLCQYGSSSSSSSSSALLRPLLKLNLTSHLLSLLQNDDSIDVILEVCAAMCHLSSVIPPDTLMEWINVGLLSRLDSILPKVSISYTSFVRFPLDYTSIVVYVSIYLYFIC